MTGTSAAHGFDRAPITNPNDPKRHLPGWEPRPGQGLVTSEEYSPDLNSYGPPDRGSAHPETPVFRVSLDEAENSMEKEAGALPVGMLNEAIRGEFSEYKHLLDDDGPSPEAVYHSPEERRPGLHKTPIETTQTRAAQLRERFYLIFRKAREAPIKAADPSRLWVAVDLDGTILTEDTYPGQYGVVPRMGKPLPGAQKALERLVNRGARVSIYTARFGDPDMSIEDVHKLRREIAAHLDKVGIAYSDIWIGRKPHATYFVDNRAIYFDGDWDDILSQIDLREGDSFGGTAMPVVDGAEDTESREAATRSIGLRPGLTSDFLDQQPIDHNVKHGPRLGEVGLREQMDPVGLEAHDMRQDY